jgi:citrate lyase subunit beta / citryl-CoA lyase
MIRTYFFVPLAKREFLEKVSNLDVDFIVYDLEDAVGQGSVELSIKNLELISDSESAFVRPRIDWLEFDFSLLDNLLNQNFKNFVIPKVADSAQIDSMFKFFESHPKTVNKLILLVENPALLFSLRSILEKYPNRLHGVSLGSHDYCSVLNAKYEYASFRYAHEYLLNLAIAYKIEPIDVASMHIESRDDFINEVKTGFNKGYRSKFILHPKQLDYLDSIEYFDEDEIKYALKVRGIIDINKTFDAVKVGGKILEKPHIDRIKEILHSLK